MKKIIIFINLIFVMLLLSAFTKESPTPSPSVNPDDYTVLQNFVCIKGTDLEKGIYTIQGQITMKKEERLIPVKGLLLYISGPEASSPANHIYSATRTNPKGYYTFKVKVPGYYEINIDNGSAINMGILHWEPKVRRLLVK